MSLSVRSFVASSLAALALLTAGSAFAAGHGPHGARALPSLTAEQRAKLDAAEEGERKARADLRVAIAGQIERGQIDKKALAPQVDAEKLAHANAKKVADETLTAEQKAELAKRHEAKAKAREERKQAQADGGSPRHGGWHRGAGVNLTPEQKKQVEERMRAEPAGDRGVDRMVDHFDAMAPVLTPAQRTELAARLRSRQ